jgi:hypothetical protein
MCSGTVCIGETRLRLRNTSLFNNREITNHGLAFDVSSLVGDEGIQIV